ncbi:MAG: Stk1 family PASTA domain-containing Ser/Thr kinase [Propionibacteriaceae bacterium]|nr:Stk1 family PASTA domain-containing Ser/Thr kinase [Propionibacteriaceae bacterium]
MGHVLDDRYEVVEKLARGGMATVYVANDLRLSRVVAVKVMNEGLGDSDDFAARFDSEARAAAHLSHANVVSVFDQGTDAGRPYIVMEYVPGFTLRQLITREAPMDPRRAIELLEPVASALAAAHAAGLIHRDIKPENVLISDRGQVKVADFGLARAVTAQSSAATTGLVIGTVSYIAPELVTKGRADARSDVYSLGIVLYEMLTGRKPHAGETPIQVAYSHVHNQVSAPSLEVSATWRDGRGGIPAYVDALVTTAAHRERDQRPRDAGVLVGHLRAAKDALARGVVDDPELVARMHRTEPDEVDGSTTQVPTVPPRLGAERRFTPVTPVSPTFDMSADGAPYYSTGPVPYSPQSPHTRALPELGDGTVPPRSPVPPPSSSPPPRWRRIVAVLAVLAVLGGAGWGGWYLLEGRWMVTPTLASLPQGEAETLAATQAVTLDVQQEFSEDVPAGTVIRTDPAGGERMLRDGILTAWVSRGPERFPVPDIYGKSRAEAEELIAAASLQVGEVRLEHHDSIAEGTVLSQSVEAHSPARRDTPVDFVVSQGPAPVQVVDYTGRPFEEMKGWAEGNALTLKTDEEHDDTVPKGSVLRQEPTSGEVRRGGSLTVTISEGPVLVTVPSGLRGLGADNAAEKVRAAGLEPEFRRLVNGGFGMVLSVEPGEGSQVPRGSKVILNLV